MMVPFFKMHGTGNDFIVIDNRPHYIQRYFDNQQLISRLCNRHLGIGADGLILINAKAGFDFEMIYFNSDGYPGTMCGNGGRCAVAAANHLNMIHGKARFIVNDIEYQAVILQKKHNEIFVKLRLNDVTGYKITDTYIFMNTGSPHHVEFVDNVMDMDVYNAGKHIRNSDLYRGQGANVDFVQLMEEHIFVRTFERGVEDETLSCGTGVVASVLATALRNETPGASAMEVRTKGGNLKVYFSFAHDTFTDIYLEGPATFVFKGEIEL